MLVSLDDIRAATQRVQDAQTQLDELAALVQLDQMVRRLTRAAFLAATEHYSSAEIARSVGQSRQAVSKRRRAGAPADPSSAP